jgi:glycosyltransferase involved in cell wall biosynthesis
VRVLIDYRPALRTKSGAGEYTHQLAAALLTTLPPGALDLTLFSSSWKDRLHPDDPQLAAATLVDRRVPVSLLNFAWHRLGWPPAELMAGAPFDITHSSHPLILPSRGAAHVVTIHDLDFLRHPERTRAEIRRDYPLLAAEHAGRADAVLVPSAFTMGEVVSTLGVPRDRVTICPPGAPDWAARKAPPPPTDGYVLFLGTLEPRKNIGALLDAYERLLTDRRRSVPRLLLAGRATAASRSWLDRIAKPPLAGVVRHIGYVDPSTRRELYEGALLLVQPSFDEGFGLPVLEAMTVGVPVVAANRGALPELIDNPRQLVDPEDPRQIADAILRLLTHADEAAACAAAGIERARRFRWDTTAHVVHAAYRAAIARRLQRIGASAFPSSSCVSV